jgi:hypothetical protein
MAEHSDVRPNSRRGAGYSLRRSLIEQGVNDELEIEKHLAFVKSSLDIHPAMDITRYRVNARLPVGVARPCCLATYLAGVDLP